MRKYTKFVTTTESIHSKKKLSIIGKVRFDSVRFLIPDVILEIILNFIQII